MKTDPIQDFILKNEHNLRIAAAVGEAWPAARDHLVSAFLDQLGAKLLKRLKGWKFEKWKHFFIDDCPCFYILKPAWQNQYYVTLQCSDYGENMEFGVQRDEDHIRTRHSCPQLLDTVKKFHPSAHSRFWWEAVINMHSPAPDWRKPEVLWLMHKDDAFLDDVAAQLLGVAKLSEPIVDQLVRKWKK